MPRNVIGPLDAMSVDVTDKLEVPAGVPRDAARYHLSPATALEMPPNLTEALGALLYLRSHSRCSKLTFRDYD